MVGEEEEEEGEEAEIMGREASEKVKSREETRKRVRVKLAVLQPQTK